MPRKTIQPQLQPEYLSILDENAELDSKLEPVVEPADLLAIHRAMVLSREFDARMLRMQRQGRIGTFPPIQGQEASQIASAYQLRPSDWMVPSFREVGSMLHRGWKMEQILLYYGGFEEGAAPPPGVRDLPICVPVTSQLPHAVGLAWASKLRGQDDVVLCYLGDGATSEGDFHEALNFASVFEVPVIFLCQNNGWAISLPTHRQTRSRTLAQKAIAFEIPSLQVDGNDPLAVFSATSEAVNRAREGGGPTFIEALTYRLSVHTTADDPKRYRSDEEVEIWHRRDPLVRYEKYLDRKKILDSDGAERVRAEVQEQIRGAVEKAEAMMQGNPLDMFSFLYEAEHPSILQQRRELEEFLEAAGIEAAMGSPSH